MTHSVCKMEGSMVKGNIHINTKKRKVMTQITLEKDMIVPDKMPDIEKSITEKGMIYIENVRTMNKKADINGHMKVEILYEPVCQVETEIPFSESVNIEDIEDGDNIRISYTIENLKVSVINSRKISIKAIVTFNIEPECVKDIEVATGCEQGENIECICRNVRFLQYVTRKKDVFRIKDEVEISKSKPNIGQIIWKNVELRNSQTRLMDNRINLMGEVNVFVIYRPDDENSPIQWIDSVLPYSGDIEVEGINETMIPDISVELSDVTVEIRPDYDGEQRVFGVDAVLDIDARIYMENEMDIIDDVYAPGRVIVPGIQNVCGENLIVKNNSQCRFSDRIDISDSDYVSDIMQICNVNGKVCIDSITNEEDGIEIQGVVETVIMYVSQSDETPFGSVRNMTPFNFRIDVNGMTNVWDYNCSINQSLMQLNYNMSGNGQIDIKGVIAFDVTVCKRNDEKFITGIEDRPMDNDKYKSLPGMVMYYVKEGERLWDIAKKYNTTMASIMEVNEMQQDDIKAGDSVMIVKQVK